MDIWEGVKQLGLKSEKVNIVKSSVCTLQKSSFLLKKTKEKYFMKINRDFTKISIHQIDRSIVLHLPSCLRSVKWIFFIYLVFEIKSCRLDRWLLGRWVGGSVSKWSVVGWSVVGGFNKTRQFKPQEGRESSFGGEGGFLLCIETLL